MIKSTSLKFAQVQQQVITEQQYIKLKITNCINTVPSHTLEGRKWQPTPALLPGKSHGQRILVGYSPWGRKELDTTEQLSIANHTLIHYTRIEAGDKIFLKIRKLYGKETNLSR